MPQPIWKQNWQETREHFDAWWRDEGLVFGAWGTGLPSMREHERIDEPTAPDDIERRNTDAEYVATNIRYKMAHREWPGDILPSAWPHGGTVPLAMYLGATPRYAPTNVWYEGCMTDIEAHPPLVFDPEHPQVKLLEGIVRRSVELARDNYCIGMPALLGGIDVLAELRGAGELMMDMIDNPDAVHRRLREIQAAYEVAFDRMYDILKLSDGSMCFGYFMLWGRGKTGLCQCDTAAMFSAEMFGEFVVPYLRQQCQHLDYSMYHLDGSQCLIDLEHLLAIDELDAVEYTPDPKVPGGGDPHWYDLYRRILKAGKAVWVANLKKDQVLPLLDAIGGKGVYVSVNGLSVADAEELAKAIEPYR
ncbi:MAG: hypothetical protein QM770_25185 [Tepidisphaeraceae bacterium]